MDGQQGSGAVTTGKRRHSRVSRGDVREETLLRAAEELLRETPPERITMETIAAAAGLSRSSVYFYFDNKNAVFAAVVHRAISRVITGLENAVPPEGPTLDATVDAMIGIVLANWRTHGFAFRIGAEFLGHDPAVRAVYDDLMDRAARVLVSAVERDRGRGAPVAGPAAGDHQRALALTWLTERNFYLLFTREHTRAEEEELTATIAQLIRRGLGYPPGPEGR